eukprot:4280721-Amphidinium_carterae.1
MLLVWHGKNNDKEIHNKLEKYTYWSVCVSGAMLSSINISPGLSGILNAVATEVITIAKSLEQ